MGALSAGATPSSSSPTPLLVRPRRRSDRCPRSASSRSSAARTAASTRRWPSGRIDEDRLRRAPRRAPPGRAGRWSLPSTPRPGTAATPSAAPSGAFTTRRPSTRPGQPIVAGWSYQWICQLDWAPDSLDRSPRRRAHPARRTTRPTATIEQIRRLVELLPDDGEVPLFVFDAGYDPIALGHDLGARAVRMSHPHPRRPGLLRRPTTSSQPTARDRRTSAPARTAVQVLGSRPGRAPIGEPRRLRPPLRHRHGQGLARSASSSDRSRTLARPRRRTADRARHRHPRRGRALAQAHLGDEEDAVAVLVRAGRA